MGLPPPLVRGCHIVRRTQIPNFVSLTIIVTGSIIGRIIAWRLAFYTLESFLINERHDYPIPQQTAFERHLWREAGFLQIRGSAKSESILALYHITTRSTVFLVAWRDWTGLVLE
jgi:hypothetical protein